MGIPIAKLAGRVALVGAMMAGGMLMAGIAQAQAQALPSPAVPTRVAATLSASSGNAPPTSADRQAELIAAVGGPAPVQHLMALAPDSSGVEARADDVQDAAPDPANALNATEVTRDQPAADPTAPR